MLLFAGWTRSPAALLTEPLQLQEDEGNGPPRKQSSTVPIFKVLLLLLGAGGGLPALCASSGLVDFGWMIVSVC